MSLTTRLTRRSLTTIVLCVGLAAVVIGAQLARPSRAQNQFAPSFKVVGELDRSIQLRQGTLTLTKVRAAKTLKTTGVGGETLTTSGIWLLVDFRFVPRRESEAMNVVFYTRDNTRFPASLRPNGDGVEDSLSGEPGFPQTGVVPFEVSPSALAHGRVVVGNNSAYGLPMWDRQAVVPLGIDDARAKKLVDHAKLVEVGD